MTTSTTIKALTEAYATARAELQSAEEAFYAARYARSAAIVSARAVARAAADRAGVALAEAQEAAYRLSPEYLTAVRMLAEGERAAASSEAFRLSFLD